MEPKNLYALLLQSKNLTTNALAEKLGGKVEQSQLNRFETGKTKEPRRSTLQPVADYFGIPVDLFYNQQALDLLAAQMKDGKTLAELLPAGKTLPVPVQYAAVSGERKEAGVHFMPAGSAKVAKYNPGHPPTLVRQFEALLLKLPEANRVAAAQAAYQAMIPYLLDATSDQPELPGL